MSAPLDVLPPPPDFAFLRRIQPILLPAYRRYFRASIEGWERLPEGPALLIGNHNGGFVMPEAPLTTLSYHEATGFQDPLCVLGHDLAFKIPGLRRFVRACGTIPARSGPAESALRAGRRVLVYPGGDHEVMRPSRDRDRIDFGGRTGFVRLALRTGVPLVPVVCAGGHDVWWCLARGGRIARGLGLDRSRFRIKAVPVALSIPWGVAPGFLPFLPFPARIKLEVLPPIELEGSAEDPAAVQRGYERATAAMQGALTRLAADLPGRR